MTAASFQSSAQIVIFVALLLYLVWSRREDRSRTSKSMREEPVKPERFQFSIARMLYAAVWFCIAASCFSMLPAHLHEDAVLPRAILVVVGGCSAIAGLCVIIGKPF